MFKAKLPLLKLAFNSMSEETEKETKLDSGLAKRMTVPFVNSQPKEGLRSGLWYLEKPGRERMADR